MATVTTDVTLLVLLWRMACVFAQMHQCCRLLTTQSITLQTTESRVRHCSQHTSLFATMWADQAQEAV